jgi:radical SAM superfamily enzyme YgiQ (UPF0313 family)
MKIYFINPKFPVTLPGIEYACRIAGKRYAAPSVSLLTIAGLTPSTFTVELCDENAYGIRWNTDADLIGLTGMHLQRRRLLEIARAFRARGKRVVVGGPSVTAMPDWYREDADVLIRGEAEYLWPRFLRDLLEGKPQPEYHETGQVDVRDSPMPRYDLINVRDYVGVGIQTTRGCPFECEFCDIIVLYGRKVRQKSIPQSMAEIERLVSLGVLRITLVDDNLIGNRPHAIALLEAIRAFSRPLHHPPTFSCQATVNVAKDRAMLQLMREAGVLNMFIGIETPRATSLAETHKYQNMRTDLQRDLETVQSHGIIVTIGSIVGFDHDDLDVFDEQVEFVRQAKVTWVFPNQLRALPRTPLYERMRQEGRLREDEPRWNTNERYGESNFIPKQMTQEQLTAGYLSMLFRWYEPEAFAQRLRGELERLDRMPGGTGKFMLSFPVVCLGFLWIFGWFLCDRHRRAMLYVFWRVVPHVLRRRRRVANFALSRLVIYYHIYHLTHIWRRIREQESAIPSHETAVARHYGNPASVPAVQFLAQAGRGAGA